MPSVWARHFLVAIFTGLGPQLTTTLQPRLSRRTVFRVVRDTAAVTAAAAVAPPRAQAIINGVEVSKAEAAAAGVVGLWIDLGGCDVCRHDVPAVCTGTLIAPDLILSARHCLDIPESLNGTLSRAVFGTSVFDNDAPSRPVIGVKKGPGDLVLLKLKGEAPQPWQPQQLPLSLLEALLPEPAPGDPAEPNLVDLMGYPKLTTYGFGDSEDDPNSYSSGVLQRTNVKVVSGLSGKMPTFFTKSGNSLSGTCNGDSGGPALFGRPTTSDRRSSKSSQVLVGILSENSMPCSGSDAQYVNPDAFRDFIVKGSAELGSPIAVPSKSEWLTFLQGAR